MYFSTRYKAGVDQNAVWSHALSQTYFPLSATCRNQVDFSGSLRSWSLGVVGLSELECSGMMVKRQKGHFQRESESSLLITIPRRTSVSFDQADRKTRCDPGAFLVERGDLPYDFWHGKPNKLWVLKVPTASIRSRLGGHDRLGGLCFDTSSGVASYFLGAVRNAIEFADTMPEVAQDSAGQHLLEMLCLSMRADDRILHSSESSVRAAHLQRAEQFIRDNLSNPKLNTQLVAESCGISVRYLQRLFSEADNSVTAFIRDKRLTRCDEALRLVDDGRTVAAIAHKWGFYDQAQFCKHYKARFGCTPTQTRKASRDAAAGRS